MDCLQNVIRGDLEADRVMEEDTSANNDENPAGEGDQKTLHIAGKTSLFQVLPATQ